ncbi:MAG TPA: hypothetical protein VKR31_17505, partial [Rhizomicrobium sp.]|nr:hypothetical protein [Rhizomicrobium sp.]
MLIREILRKRADLAQLVIEDAIPSADARLISYLDAALAQVLYVNPDEARRYARRFLDSGNAGFQRAVGRAFSHPPMPEGTLASADAEIIQRVLSSSDPDVVFNGLGVLSTLAQKNWRIAIDLLRHANLSLDARLADRAFMMLHGLQQDILAALDEDDVRYLLSELKPLPELNGHWVETLLSYFSLHFPELTASFFLTRVEQATASEEAFSRFRPINYGPWVHVPLRFKESPRYSAVLQSVWEWITARNTSDWRFEHHASALFEGMFLPIDDVVLSFLTAKMTTAEPHALRWIASVLSHADSNFVFDQHRMVVSFLDLCDRAGESVRRKAVGALFRSAISGVHGGAVGEPWPRDIKFRNESQTLMARLPRLSAAYELYEILRAHADQSIVWARKDAEALDDA